jgi:hypothetical protein
MKASIYQKIDILVQDGKAEMLCALIKEKLRLKLNEHVYVKKHTYSKTPAFYQFKHEWFSETTLLGSFFVNGEVDYYNKNILTTLEESITEAYTNNRKNKIQNFLNSI